MIKAARRQKNETNAYLNRMEKEWQASLGQWPGKGGKGGKSGKSGKGKSSKGGKSKGKSSKGDSKSGKGKGDRDRNKGKGMFGSLNLADISKMSKEQAQAVLAKYAEAVQGQYAVVPKKKKGDQNRWSQDANSTEYRKWQAEQQKTTLRSNRSSVCTFATKWSRV